MSKRALLRFATSVCVSVSLLFSGQISAFADELSINDKPYHEYTFDNDVAYTVVDSPYFDEIAIDGRHSGSVASLVAGYNGIGKAKQFYGSNMLTFPSQVLPVGAQSIRFQFKKDISTVTAKSEPIFSTNSTSDKNYNYTFYMGIGKYAVNDNPIQGHIWILKKNNFELQSPESICDGKWHDILFTWDGTTNTNAVKLYIDDMATPVAQTTATSADKRINSDGNIYVGSTSYHINDSYKYLSPLIGDMDNLQFFHSAIKLNATDPGDPTTPDLLNLKAIAGNSRVDLSWNALTDAASYIIKRSTIAGGPYTTIASGTIGNTYTDTDVINGTSYYYIITEVVNGKENKNSNEASATPQASTDPNQPTGNKALLVISMVTGERKEYVMTTDKINDFITWYNSKAASSPIYVIEKDYNKASFTARKDYIAYEQISSFEVNEYNN